MYVKFWGTRGSIAAPGARTARFGGNTSCVEVRAPDGTMIVLDCGTGARELGLHLLRTAPRPLRMHVFIGHTHWDHIQGFPFFAPAFMPGVEVNIYAPVGFQKSLGEAMAGQMEYAYFPVKLRDLRSRIHFTELDEGFFRVGDVLVETQYLNHTAPTIAYRMTCGNATVAYVTDHEPYWPGTDHFNHPGDQRHLAFLKGVDLLVHDAQYTDEEYRQKLGWGHSSIEYATDMASAAGVRRLALFHHDPTHDDDTMERLELAAQDRAARHGTGLDVFAAREAIELEVKGEGATARVTGDSALRRVPILGSRVAVVLSEQSEVESIERELAEDGLTLLLMPDAETARARIPEVRPDIVIAGSHLPDGDGVALVNDLRALMSRADMPAIVLTDEVGQIGEPRWDERTAMDYLARPFSPPMLRARLRAWLSRSLAPTDGAVTLSPQPSAAAHHVPTVADRLVETLRGMPLFRPLTIQQIQELVHEGVDHEYLPGQTMVREGTPSDSLFVILSGRARVTETVLESHAELVLTDLGPGEVFGELGIIRNQPRSATVVALDRTRCAVLRPDRFIRALEHVPGLALGMVQVLASRLTDTDRKLARYAPDALTGLMTRRAFVDQYRRLAAGARRRRTGAVLMLLDVVELRLVNDRYGYGVGDEVLKAVADALLDATRTTDLVARWGGDEFALLLADAEPSDPEVVVERVSARLANPRREAPADFKCSIGIAFSATPPDAPDDLVREADADMHRRRFGG